MANSGGGSYGGNSAQWQPRGGFQYSPPQSPMTGGEYVASGSRFMPVNYAAPQQAPASNPWGLGGFTGNEWKGAAQGQDQVQMASQPVNRYQPALATTGDTPIAGMSAAALNDPNLPMMYRKQLQAQFGTGMPQAPQTNFWANTGAGTQRPPGFPTPPEWGQQTYGFDPRAMAGKQVTGDLGWYYGRDAIGRTINNQGDAVPSFSAPADGFQRRRPWMG